MLIPTDRNKAKIRKVSFFPFVNYYSIINWIEGFLRKKEIKKQQMFAAAAAAYHRLFGNKRNLGRDEIIRRPDR